MAELRQYDPNLVTATWSTAIGSFDLLDGAVDGSFIAVAKDNTVWSRERDRFGNTTRVKNNGKGGTCSVTHSASSPTNRKLTIAAKTDQGTENIVGTIVLCDLNGDTVVTMTGAFIEDVPTPSYGATRGERTWVFQCAEIDVVLDGHEVA